MRVGESRIKDPDDETTQCLCAIDLRHGQKSGLNKTIKVEPRNSNFVL